MMKRAHFRLGSNKWNPTIYKGGTEYKAVNLYGYYGEYELNEVEAHFLKGNTVALGWDNIRHKWDNNYTFSVYYIRTASFNDDLRGLNWNINGTGAYSPIELSAHKNGWYLDFHKPKNTTSNETTGSTRNNDLEWRVMYSNISNVNTNTIYRLDINATPNHTLTLYELDGTQKSSYSSLSDGASSFKSSYDFYDGYYLLRLFGMQYVAVGRIVIRDASDNVIHDYMMIEDESASGNARYVLKDFIEDYSTACIYTGTLTDVMTQNFTIGTL